jgi:RNA polymerase sigma-70 factor (ECF subfamily)
MLDFSINRDAFNQFIQQHRQRVYQIVLPVVQNEADAEEITQDVFVEAYQTAANFRGDAAISTWLYRIAMNKCIDHLRKMKRKKRFAIFAPLFNPHTHEPTAGAGADFYHPGIAAENKEKAAFLFKALRQLPEKQQSAWVLFEMEQLDYRQIADILNCSQSSVESLLFRARQNLRKVLEKFYPGP